MNGQEIQKRCFISFIIKKCKLKQWESIFHLTGWQEFLFIYFFKCVGFFECLGFLLASVITLNFETQTPSHTAGRGVDGCGSGRQYGRVCSDCRAHTLPRNSPHRDGSCRHTDTHTQKGLLRHCSSEQNTQLTYMFIDCKLPNEWCEVHTRRYHAAGAWWCDKIMRINDVHSETCRHVYHMAGRMHKNSPAMVTSGGRAWGWQWGDHLHFIPYPLHH